jgi:hypothetical protein
LRQEGDRRVDVSFRQREFHFLFDRHDSSDKNVAESASRKQWLKKRPERRPTRTSPVANDGRSVKHLRQR